MVGVANVRNFIRERLMRGRMAYYRHVEGDYASAYRRLMRWRVNAHGAEHAVGAHDHDFGQRQFQFLVDCLGLERDETFVDVGCGSLRAGKYLIPYLEPGRYVGLDVSPDALQAGRDRMSPDVLAARQPTLICNDDLRFEDVNRKASLVWAHSLVTHLPEDDLVELLGNVTNILADDGQAFFSFFDESQHSSKDFGYSVTDLHDIAGNHPIHLHVYDEDVYTNPKGQRLLSVRRHSRVPDRLFS